MKIRYNLLDLFIVLTWACVVSAMLGAARNLSNYVESEIFIHICVGYWVGFILALWVTGETIVWLCNLKAARKLASKSNIKYYGVTLLLILNFISMPPMYLLWIIIFHFFN